MTILLSPVVCYFMIEIPIFAISFSCFGSVADDERYSCLLIKVDDENPEKNRPGTIKTRI